MYIHVKEDGTSEVIHSLPKNEEEEQHELLCTVDRVKEELEGFLDYKEMDKVKKTSRYANVSMQEFQHFLLALDDLFTEMTPCLTDTEKAEFRKFIASIHV